MELIGHDGPYPLEEEGRFRLPAWLAWVGDFSYSLYLVHIFELVVVSRLLPRQWAVLRIAAAPLMLLAAIGAGTVCYYVLEKPFMALVKRQKKRVFEEHLKEKVSAPRPPILLAAGECLPRD